MHTDQYIVLEANLALEAPQGQFFYGLVLGTYSLGLGLEGPGLGHDFESCIDIIFDMTLRLKARQLLLK